MMHLQHVADDADRPHVGGVAYGLEADHLGGDELGRAEENLQFFHRLKLSGQTKVDYFDAVAGPCQAQNVFGLHKKEGSISATTMHQLFLKETFRSRWMICWWCM